MKFAFDKKAVEKKSQFYEIKSVKVNEDNEKTENAAITRKVTFYMEKVGILRGGVITFRTKSLMR